MFNKITNNVNLIGNLGKEVEIKNFESGSKKATFSLATTESVKNKKGEYEKVTQWHNIIAWGSQAEILKNSITKGSTIAVQGSLQYRSYTDGNGVTRYITEIVMTNFKPISIKKQNVEKEELAEALPF